ncbi:MAG TPA: MBL fold metallo-hydrolase [Polyangiaceae bacterium]|nr:MBL fold metallo-hydrolase [Polyangiaceae bacterium]
MASALTTAFGAEIVRVPLLPLGMLNAHIVFRDQRAIIVDAGLPGTAPRFERALAERRLGWGNVRLIVVTHGHVDHAGDAARMRDLSGAPIVAQRRELPVLQGEEQVTRCPTGWFGRAFLKTRLPFQAFEPFRADVVVDDAPMDLASFGIPGQLLPTPGHTAGSLSVELPGSVALVGDLVASGILLGGIAFTERCQQPPFEDDPAEVADQLERLLETGTETFLLGHGGPVTGAAVRQHVRRLRQIARMGRSARAQPAKG